MKTMTRTLAALFALALVSTAAAQTNRDDNGGGGDQQNRRFQRQYQQDDQGGGRRNRRYYAQAGGYGGFAATTQPGAEQTVIPTPRDMTADYLILTEQSIFSPVVPIGVGPGPTQTGPREQTLVFDAATRTDGVFAASLEDTESNKITIVHVGDAIAQGKVTSISLEQMAYQSHGITRQLGIGQNLVGEQIFGSGVVLTTLPEGAVDMNGPNADILKKMMLRRQQELTGH
jgi:hypothetical protein